MDTLEKLSAQGDLEHQNETFQLLAESIPQHVWIGLDDGLLCYANQRCLEYTGYTDAEMKAGGNFHCIHPGDVEKAMKAQQVAVELGTGFDVELRLRRYDGVYRWHVCRAIPIKDKAGSVRRWFGTNTDIDDQKSWSVELEKAKQEAEEASKAKSAFLANVSHEIRTPLGIVLGFADLLRTPALNQKKREEYYATIHRNGQDLLKLIDDILDLSKVEAGSLLVESYKFSFAELIQGVQESFSFEARAKDIDLQFQVMPNFPDQIQADADRLRQILFNIIGNAIKFTPRGRVAVHSAFYASEKNPSQFLLEIIVRDTGIGMSEEEVGRIFRPFSQADSSTTRHYGGSGLGLTLSRNLARNLGGDVTLEESTPSAGSVFAIRIPVTAVEAPAEADHALPSYLDPSTYQPPALLEGRKILIVEDAKDIQFLIQHFLGEAGAQTWIANDGIEAMEMVDQRPYDLVLMDIQMPRQDGYETTRLMREGGFTFPILALTAHAMKGERTRCLEVGCNDLLTKPFDPSVLIRTIHHYVVDSAPFRPHPRIEENRIRVRNLNRDV